MDRDNSCKFLTIDRTGRPQIDVVPVKHAAIFCLSIVTLRGDSVVRATDLALGAAELNF